MRVSLLVLVIGLVACADRGFAPRHTQSEEAVYETVIDAALFSDWGRDTVELAGRHPRFIRLSSGFATRPLNPDHAETMQWLRQGMPLIPQPLLDAYVQRSAVGGGVPTDLRARVPLRLRSFDESGWPRQGVWASLVDLVLPSSYVVLTPAVFSPDSLHVLVEVSTYRRDWHQASGVLVWLEWSGEAWRIADYTLSWIT